MGHSLTLNYKDKESQFFAQGGGKGGGIRLVRSCSLPVAVPSPQQRKKGERELLLPVFSFVGERVRLHVGYRSCPCLSQLRERLHQGGCQHIFKEQVLS